MYLIDDNIFIKYKEQVDNLYDSAILLKSQIFWGFIWKEEIELNRMGSPVSLVWWCLDHHCYWDEGKRHGKTQAAVLPFTPHLVCYLEEEAGPGME